MKLIRSDVSIIYRHDIRIAFHDESQLVESLGILHVQHSSALLIYCIDANVHQILTVSMPGLHIRNQLQSHSLARGLYLMASHHLAVLLGHSHQSTWSIGDVVPLDAGAELRVVAVLLHTQTLAVQEEFHLVAIGIGIERNLLACLTVPVF